MKAYGNGLPETCALNLMRIVRGEVPYDRRRGRNSAFIDAPSKTMDAAADAEWLLENYEPRVDVNVDQNGNVLITEKEEIET